MDLHPEGSLEARRAGELLSATPIYMAHVSDLSRAKQTLEEIRKHINEDAGIKVHLALNERNYGIYTGKNKAQMKEEMGEEEFKRIRRGWDAPVPEGESLKDVHDRAVPYFEESILPDLNKGKNILVVSHGNTLRALIKRLENISDEAICDVEIGTGEVHCYDMNAEGQILNKEILALNSDKGKV